MKDWLNKNKLKIAVVTVLVCNILIWNFYLSLADGKLHLKFYDIGQGDAIFLETAGGYRILVDGGPDNKLLEYLGEDLPFYSKNLDLVVATHPQADHIAGLVEVIKQYKIGSLWINGDKAETRLYQEWERALRGNSVQPVVVAQGDKILFPDQTQIEVIWPKSGPQSLELNDRAIVLKITFGSFDALLTSDADSRVQPYTSSLGHFEVFKVPHHGSKTGLKEDFVRSLSPEVSIISVGAKNRYGHPGQNIIQFLITIGSKVYRTDQNGAVEIVTDGQTWYTKADR